MVEEREQEKIYSKRVKAGKRTYFFDVRSTRSGDYYLTLTESRRYPKGDGFVYEKSKMFVYKEDFNKFAEALNETIGHIKTELMPDFDFAQFDREDEEYERRAPRVSASSDSSETEIPETPSDASSDLKWE